MPAAPINADVLWGPVGGGGVEKLRLHSLPTTDTMLALSGAII